MVTTKLKAIKKIITAKHVMLFTKKSGDTPVEAYGFGTGSLHDIMLIAIELKKSYNRTVDMVEQGATEEGTLHAFMEMKKTIEALENGHK